MGGKSSSSSSSSDAAMLKLLSSAAVTTPTVTEAAETVATPAALEMPEIVTATEVDWTEQNSQLSAKAKADYQSDLASKKGRLDTVLTSPLLDDDETGVSQSLLTGS